jgi:hypothetical protein
MQCSSNVALVLTVTMHNSLHLSSSMRTTARVWEGQNIANTLLDYQRDLVET